MVSTAKVYMLELVPKLKTNKSLKLLLLDIKANSSILMALELEMPFFYCGPSS